MEDVLADEPILVPKKNGKEDIYVSGVPELVVLQHHHFLPVQYRCALNSTTNFLASQLQDYSSTINFSYLPAPLRVICCQEVFKIHRIVCAKTLRAKFNEPVVISQLYIFNLNPVQMLRKFRVLTIHNFRNISFVLLLCKCVNKFCVRLDQKPPD